jgi:hypothetical protein
MQDRYSSSEIQMPDVKATAGIVEIPLAQTGEGIADCELIKWFVKEVPLFSHFIFNSFPLVHLGFCPPHKK